MTEVSDDQAPTYAPPAPTPDVQYGAQRPWEVSAALAIGWDRIRRFWPVLVFAPLLAGLIMQGVSYLLSMLRWELGDSTGGWLLGLVDATLAIALGAFFGVGLIRIFVTAVRGTKPEFSTLFTGGDRLLPLLFTQVLMGLAVTAGLILLIAPGIVLALGFCMAPFVCVDQKLGAVDSLEASWAMTMGSKTKLFGYACVALLIIIAGALALGIGMLIAFPVVYAGVAWIYLRLRGELVPRRVGERAVEPVVGGVREPTAAPPI